MCIFCTDHTKKQRNFSAPLLHMLNLKSNNYEKQVNTHLGLCQYGRVSAAHTLETCKPAFTQAVRVISFKVQRANL